MNTCQSINAPFQMRKLLETLKNHQFINLNPRTNIKCIKKRLSFPELKSLSTVIEKRTSSAIRKIFINDKVRAVMVGNYQSSKPTWLARLSSRLAAAIISFRLSLILVQIGAPRIESFINTKVGGLGIHKSCSAVQPFRIWFVIDSFR